MKRDTVGRPKKKTREDLVREIGTLEEALRIEAHNDQEVRKTLSELLESYETKKDPEYYGGNREVRRELKVLDWHGIAFKIGELRGDAMNTRKGRQIKDLLQLTTEQHGELQNMREEIRSIREGRRDDRR